MIGCKRKELNLKKYPVHFCTGYFFEFIWDLGDVTPVCPEMKKGGFRQPYDKNIPPEMKKRASPGACLKVWMNRQLESACVEAAMLSS